MQSKLFPKHGRQLVMLLISLLAFMTSPARARDEALVREIRLVDAVFDASEVPPPPQADWQSVSLPLQDAVAGKSPDKMVRWFRFVLDKPEGDAPRSLYFPRYNQSLDVWLNGEYIGGDKYRPGFETVAWNHPLLVNIQHAVWKEGANQVMIRFRDSLVGEIFSPVLFGPTETLASHHRLSTFRQVTFNSLMLVLGFLLVIASFIMWLLRRKDHMFLEFAVICTCWMIVDAQLVVYQFPIPYPKWLAIEHMAIDVWIYLVYYFICGLLDVKPVPQARVMKVTIPVAWVWHLAPLHPWWWAGTYVFHSINILVLGWLLYLTAPGINPARYRLARILLLLVIAQVLFYTVDLVRSFFGNIDVWGESFLTQLAFPLMQLVLMGALFNRFLTTLQQAEELNRTLASKIEASRRDIELSFSNKRAHELQQAADTERIRIYRELHDDLGSKLLSIAHAGRDSRMGDLASSALQSLRESVSRANYPDQPLAKFVQDLKEETLLRLESSGHRVDWHQAHLPDCMVPSHIAFHLNRMAKEIVTNIIRHARASHVSAGVETEQGDLVFSLSDNGIGIGMNGYSGNGMQNIRTRAEEIAGKVRFESPAGKGLTVTLSIPLDTGREEDG